MQIQTDKEKLLYELDNLQRELEKAQVNTTRFQHEKEDFEVDSKHQREKNEKLQVRAETLNGNQTSRLSNITKSSYLSKKTQLCMGQCQERSSSLLANMKSVRVLS